MAFLAMLPAIIGAVASTVGGIAGAAGQGAAADAQSKMAAEQRAAQERIAKLQLAGQKRQAALNEQQGAYQLLSAANQDQANSAIEQGRATNSARARLLADMSRAFGVG